jgi:hypothetical protein
MAILFGKAFIYFFPKSVNPFFWMVTSIGNIVDDQKKDLDKVNSNFKIIKLNYVLIVFSIKNKKKNFISLLLEAEHSELDKNEDEFVDYTKTSLNKKLTIDVIKFIK